MHVTHVLAFGVIAFASCFYPNRDITSGDSLCNPIAPHSSCCAAGVICTNNSVCMDLRAGSTGIFHRGSCTDPSWKDSACASFCDDGR